MLVIFISILPWAAWSFSGVCGLRPEIGFAMIAGLMGSWYVYRTICDYRQDLTFYKTSQDLELDSDFAVTLRVPGGMSGYNRMFFYYPCMFLICSVLLMQIALISICR